MTDEKRKHPFTCFYTEILEKIIAPKIMNVVSLEPASSRSDLLRKFNQRYNSQVSTTTFADWCDQLDVRFETVVNVSIPGYRATMATRQPTIPQKEIEDNTPVVFDEPIRDISSPVFQMGERMVLPGGMKAPSYYED
jgi:hypothetical protein